MYAPGNYCLETSESCSILFKHEGELNDWVTETLSESVKE